MKATELLKKQQMLAEKLGPERLAAPGSEMEPRVNEKRRAAVRRTR
jgi:hypothetical protein